MVSSLTKNKITEKTVHIGLYHILLDFLSVIFIWLK